MAIRTAFVGPGDDLYRLASRFYGDASAWTLLRNANPQLRGDAQIQRSTQIIIPEFNGLYAGNGLTLPGATLPLNNSVSIPATDVELPAPAPPPVVTTPPGSGDTGGGGGTTAVLPGAPQNLSVDAGTLPGAPSGLTANNTTGQPVAPGPPTVLSAQSS